MTKFCPFLNPLQRDGTSQNQRLLDALLPENNPIDERSQEDLLAYLQKYAALLVYYDVNDFPSGNWKDFIELVPPKESSDHPPHMALLLAFLKLFDYLKEHLNTLTAKHLDFYYRDTLQLLRKEERPDQVHLIFELAKQIDQHRLEKEELFKAGKDAKGKNRFYGSNDELAINKAVLSEEYGLKTVFIEKSGSGRVTGIHAASYANSSDGLGAAIEDEEGKWETFGSAKMPEVTLGFAVASPMFYLAEGERNITVKFYLESLLASDIEIIKNALCKHVHVFCSGEKQWVPCTLSKVIISDELDGSGEPDKSSEADIIRPVPVQPDITGISGDNNLIFKMAAPIGKMLKKQKRPPYIEFVVHLNPEDEAVVAYNDEVLQDGFASSLPIVKFALILSCGNKNDESNTAHYAYDYLSKINIESLEINVDVKGVRNLILENDIGVLNPAKPFHPFGSVPKKGSKFYIGSNEVFQKTLETVDLKITWGDLPEENFQGHYAEYNGDGDEIVSGNSHFKAELSILTQGAWAVAVAPTIFKKPATNVKKRAMIIGSAAKNNGNTGILRFIKAPFIGTFVPKGLATQLKVPAFYKIKYNLFKEHLGLPEQDQDFSYKNPIRRPNTVTPITRFDVGLQSGFMRMELLTSFLHNLYPTALAKAVTTSEAIPSTPYTPLITELKLNYTAKETINYKTLKTNDSDHLIEQLFHITPFGQVAFLPFSMPSAKKTDNVKEVISQHLLTDFPLSMESNESAVGTLYIGIDKLKPPQNLSILFQIAESSADPDFTVPQVFWSYLVNNQWVAFTDAEILADKTNGLLTSGIIRFAMPKQITSNNTLLPKDIHWIKASVKNDTAAIAQLIAVKSQAVVASFFNEQNDVSHLGTALPAETISKLKQRNTKIKTISQPFASFDGQLPEHDVAFYRRVSERLRHKGRAITIFDYERLVLEQFPSIYKIKCINHTQKRDEYSPGHVRLIVVPDLRNKNAVDPLRPRATVNMLQKIDRYISRLTSDFVSVEVSNPQYEEIKVDFKVAFHEGFDHGFYLKQLEQDIIKFLSPWLYDNAADISFGGRIHRTWVLNHIEEQEYVDFVTDFRMHHLFDEDGRSKLDIEEAIVQSSSSVLVSSKTHKIILADKLVCEETLLGSRDEG